MEDTSQTIKLEIKTPKESKIIEISLKASIADLKSKVSEVFNTPTDTICLICQGKIMKDIEILSQYSLKDNSKVHLVIKNSQKSKIVNPSLPASSTVVPEQNQPTTSNSTTNTSSLSNFPKMDESQVSFASQMMKSLPSEYLEMIVKQNPMTKKLLEDNPELRSQLTGSNIKKMAEMLSNPTMAAELMRNQENMMQQIQNIPGAASHLERMMNSMPDFQQENPYAYEENSLGTNPSRQSDQVRPNLSGEPIPDPWGNSSQQNLSSSNPNSNLNTNSNNFGIGNDFSAFSKWLSGQRNIDNNQTSSNVESSINQNLPSDINSNTFNMMANFDPSTFSDLMKPNVMNAINSLSENIEIIKKEAPSLLPSLSKMMVANNPSLPFVLQNQNFPNPSSLQPRNFDEEIKQMNSMGFIDDDLNRRALEVSNGNVNLAVEWLIKNNFI